MVDRLGEFVMPYQQALATEVVWYFYASLPLQGTELFDVARKKRPRRLAAWLYVERQAGILHRPRGPWDHLSLKSKALVRTSGLFSWFTLMGGSSPSIRAVFPECWHASVGVKRQLVWAKLRQGRGPPGGPLHGD